MNNTERRTHTNKYAKQASLRPVQWLLHQPVVGIAIHWIFQGMLYMDVTERCFKITIDIVLTVGFAAALSSWVDLPAVLIAAWLVAHTLNFFFNAHLWVLLKHYGLMSNSFERYQGYVIAFQKRVQREMSIDRAGIYGSLSRDQWSPTSDLDVRLVRKAGCMNGIRACWFVMGERSRALFAKFPLDVYVLDNACSLAKMNADEQAIEL
jgi:hypothetical protein